MLASCCSLRYRSKKIASKLAPTRISPTPRLCRSELARELLRPQIPQQKDRETSSVPTKISPTPASVGASLLASCCGLRYRSKKIASKLAPTKISPTPHSVGASLPRELLQPQIPQQKIARQARSYKNFTNPTLCRSELASRAVAAADTAAKRSRASSLLQGLAGSAPTGSAPLWRRSLH